MVFKNLEVNNLFYKKYMNSIDLLMLIIIVVLIYVYIKYFYYTPYSIQRTPNLTMINTTDSFFSFTTTLPGYITSVTAVFNTQSSVLADGCGLVIGNINYTVGGLYPCRFDNGSACQVNNLGSQVSYDGLLAGFNMYSPSSPIKGLTTQPPLFLTASNNNVKAVSISQSDSVLLNVTLQNGSAVITLKYGLQSNSYTLNIGVGQLPNQVTFFCASGSGINGKASKWTLYSYEINGEKPTLFL